MTSIEQLVVSGIRSFNPDTCSRQGIRFQKPLTIILGPNGSGKTTVIEALRNACTGELPTNTGKGAAFIHDPKVAGETEVKAQIRLQFRTATGQQMLIGRSYQLTQTNATKQKFETLDVSLQTRDPKTGHVVSQSYKCSDIDKLVPDLLGISKPILDNVIFLHQDDTNWPLAEAAKLKKKFDDIFSSTRYTKALEEMRKVMKENKEKIREQTTYLAMFKEKRGAAHQLRRQIEETQQRVQTAHEQIKGVDARAEKVVARLEETAKQSDEIQELEGEAMKLQGTVEALVQQREAMCQSLRVVSEESDEQLATALDQFANLVTELRNTASACEVQLRERHRENRADDETAVKLKSQREFLISQTNEHQRRVQQLQHVIQDTSATHGLPLPYVGGDSHFDEGEVLRFFDAFSEKVRQLKDKRDAVRVEARRAQEDTERLLSEARQRRDHLLMQHKAVDGKAESIRPRLRELKDRFNELSTAEASATEARARVQELEAGQVAAKAQEAQTVSKLSDLSKQHQDLRSRTEVLQREARSRQEEQQAAHKLRMLRAEKAKLEGDVASRKSEVDAKFVQLVGRKLQSTNFHEEVNQSLRSKQQAIDKVQRQVSEADREVAVCKQQLEQLGLHEDEVKEQVVSKEKSYLSLEKEYGKDLPELLKKAEQREEKDRKTVATMQALQMCHENFSQQAEDERCCPVCARSMGDAELGVMQRNMRQKLQDVPVTISRKEEALQKTQHLVRKVRGLLPVHSEVQNLKQELPKLSKKQRDLTDRFETQSEVLKDLSTKVESLRFEERELRALFQTVERVRELQVSAKSIDETIAVEESKIAAKHGVGVRPLDLVQKEIETHQVEMNRVLAAQQQVMRDSEERRAEQQRLQEQLQRQQRLVDEKLMLAEERQRVRAQYDAALEEYKRGAAESSEAKAKLPQVEEQLRKCEQELRAQREQGDQREASLTAEVEKQQQEHSRLSALVGEIKKYVQGNKPDVLEAVVSKLMKLEDAQKDRLTQIEALEGKIAEYSKKISQQDITRRELEANLLYRKKCREVERAEKQLQKVRATVREKTKGHEGVWLSLDKLREEKAGLDKERAQYTGQMQATEALLRERQKELQSTKYDKIDERYNSTLIRLATAQMTEEDMQAYYGALDCALMKYHDEKITEMNEIIRDLWIRTYRGHDIDYIELRSDVEATGTGTATNRNYNYRVVMVKAGVALDMRGRCSAGQRVLASLVVRLALSQAFCCDCGVLALDEPTTNLDVENIDSLAYALTEIIQSRRGQSNFQLIIITHDEQFVRRIGHACSTETVFHISKDPEGQFSTITERDFSEMM